MLAKGYFPPENIACKTILLWLLKRVLTALLIQRSCSRFPGTHNEGKDPTRAEESTEMLRACHVFWSASSWGDPIWPKHLGKKRVDFLLQLWVHCWRKPRQDQSGTWRQELNQGLWGNFLPSTLEDLMARNGTACSGLGPPKSVIN